MDGVERVFCSLVARTNSSLHVDDGDVIYQHVNGWIGGVSLIHNVGVGAMGKVADDDNSGVCSWNKFFFDLEPSVFQVFWCYTCEGKVIFGL